MMQIMRKRINKHSIALVFFFSVVNLCAGQEIRRVSAIDLESYIAKSDKPMIINMWATWCQPCIAELPYFLEEVNRHNSSSPADSIGLLLVSLDFKESYPEGILAFAAKRKVDATIVWLDETNADYFCPKVDSKWSGAIPATLFINNKTGYRKFVEEQLSHAQLKEEIMAILK
jgi:thiol-disulfide isomerase/thioredoxin